VLVAALTSCSLTATSASSPSPSQATQAADLRTQLDLLLTEHVMILAKESASAMNSSEEYAGYTALLATNEQALVALVGRAGGHTSAALFSRAWEALNADLVEYAIRVATHDGDRADAATSRLTKVTMPALADRFAELTLAQSQPFLVMITTEVTAIRDTIDAAADHHYAAMYTRVAGAVSAATNLGDTVSQGLVSRFPDMFPGDQASPDATHRVHLNVLMQERAYLVTMTTDALLNGRADEKTQALTALTTNLNLVVTEVNDSRSRKLWADELAAIQSYTTSGDAASKSALSENFVSRLASTTNLSPGIVSNQVDATIRVIDDQRSKQYDAVAQDDRTAATGMQPIADSL
jgi:phage tail protein X